MKKFICLVTALLMVGLTVSAQDEPQKKKGGFWNKVKKGVESTTGLNVSKETLFVYPTLGEWKMSLVSAIADPETGDVVVKINASWLMNAESSASFKLKGVVGGGGVVLQGDKDWEYGSNGFDFTAGVPTEVTFRRITVPKDMPSIDAISFTIMNTEGFEIRDIPITWMAKE